MKLIVGLGNPGTQYARTRHNIGAMVADALAAEVGAGWKIHKKSGAELATASYGGHTIHIAKPRTYMNETGRQVGPLMKFFSAAPADLIVLHDELDIAFGLIRLKRGGGEGGHNGLRSITSAVGSRDYLRVRLGIGRPPGRQDPASFVLKPFSAAERDEVPLLIAHGRDAAGLLVTQTLEEAQNTVHMSG